MGLLPTLATIAVVPSWMALGPAQIAYIGPGGGLTALGALLAILLAILVGIFGFLWYPIRRWRRKKRHQRAESETGST